MSKWSDTKTDDGQSKEIRNAPKKNLGVFIPQPIEVYKQETKSISKDSKELLRPNKLKINLKCHTKIRKKVSLKSF